MRNLSARRIIHKTYLVMQHMVMRRFNTQFTNAGIPIMRIFKTPKTGLAVVAFVFACFGCASVQGQTAIEFGFNNASNSTNPQTPPAARGDSNRNGANRSGANPRGTGTNQRLVDPFGLNEPAAGRPAALPGNGNPGSSLQNVNPLGRGGLPNQPLPDNPRDPTSVRPDLRRVLQGEPEQTRREPLALPQTVAIVINAAGDARAMLQFNGRYQIVSVGTRLNLPGGAENRIVSVTKISDTGVELRNEAEKKDLVLP
ncbi:MAG: hypothetical protein AAFP69_10245 [Planctomycetota bacterium]